jgi:hypothetical protein
MRFLAIVIGLIIVMPVFGQRKKKDEDVVVVPTYVEGVVYALPQTALRVYVKATKEVFEPGPYAGYAEQLLGINNVKTKAETKWTITEVRITSFAEPDPTQIFKATGDVAYKISLTSDGRISGMNLPNSTEQPVVLKTNKLIELADEPDDFSFDYFTDTPFYTPGDSTNGFQPVRVSTDQKAAEAAKRVLDCRVTRYDMVAGMMDEFHPDGEAYKVSLEELKQIEKNYLSLFVGHTTRKNDIFTFNFIPTKPTENGEVVFRISDEGGVVPADDLSGKPVMIEFEVEKAMMDKYTELAKSENPNAGENGLYYRMPAITTIRIVNELNTVSTARLPIAQFGVVAPLPEKIVKGGYMVKYNTETGAIKSVYKR